MITVSKTQDTDFLVKLVDSKKFKDFHLGFKAHTYNPVEKTFYFGTKKDYDHDELMELFARIVKTMESMKIDKFSIDVHKYKKSELYGIVLGLVLSSYKYKEKDEFPMDITLITKKGDEDISEYVTLATNINMAKVLSNMPACSLTPRSFVEIAYKALENNEFVTIEVIEEDQIIESGMGGLYGVGKGSIHRPCMLVINYTPDPGSDVFGLVGKGVTFDTGGYNLKLGPNLPNMKGDMGGASSVFAIIKTAIEMKVENNLVAVIPLCENRISDGSILPGDIISMYDGTTVEVLNTDAEGRLILADAVTYAVKNKNVTGLIDMATLTGAAAAAFGPTITPILSSSDDLNAKLEKATKITHEKFINIPYYKEHTNMIKSTMADIKNLGGKSCGIITAGLFIKHFTQNTPWIHFDIAGTHAVDAPVYEYQQAGAVGGAIASVYYLVK